MRNDRLSIGSVLEALMYVCLGLFGMFFLFAVVCIQGNK